MYFRKNNSGKKLNRRTKVSKCHILNLTNNPHQQHSLTLSPSGRDGEGLIPLRGEMERGLFPFGERWRGAYSPSGRDGEGLISSKFSQNSLKS